MLPKKYKYRPLPDGLTIAESSIEGLGLFTKIELHKDHCLGYSHLTDKRFENDLIRTPLGGFINHADKPNCEIRQTKDTFQLYTISRIPENTELTVDYNKIIK